MDIKLCGHTPANWSDLKCSTNYITARKSTHPFTRKRNWKTAVKKKKIIINLTRAYHKSTKIYYFIIFRFLHSYTVKNIFNICNLFISLLFEKQCLEETFCFNHWHRFEFKYCCLENCPIESLCHFGRVGWLKNTVFHITNFRGRFCTNRGDDSLPPAAPLKWIEIFGHAKE